MPPPAELVFPTSLPTEMRGRVHSIAERLELAHFSTGEGTQRFITVRALRAEDLGEGELLLYSCFAAAGAHCLAVFLRCGWYRRQRAHQHQEESAEG